MPFVTANSLINKTNKTDDINITLLKDIHKDIKKKINIIAVIRHIGPIGTITSKSGELISIRRCLIDDDSQSYISFTLWRDKAYLIQQFNVGDIIYCTSLDINNIKIVLLYKHGFLIQLLIVYIHINHKKLILLIKHIKFILINY